MSELVWRRVKQYEQAIQIAWLARGGPPPGPRVFYAYEPSDMRREVLHALVSRDGIANDVYRWHISVSGPGRVPTWDELANAAHELRPGVAFAAGVPPRSWWINVHEHVLHLWELDDPPLLDQWRSERRGDEPT